MEDNNTKNAVLTPRYSRLFWTCKLHCDKTLKWMSGHNIFYFYFIQWGRIRTSARFLLLSGASLERFIFTSCPPDNILWDRKWGELSDGNKEFLQWSGGELRPVIQADIRSQQSDNPARGSHSIHTIFCVGVYKNDSQFMGWPWPRPLAAPTMQKTLCMCRNFNKVGAVITALVRQRATAWDCPGKTGTCGIFFCQVFISVSLVQILPHFLSCWQRFPQTGSEKEISYGASIAVPTFLILRHYIQNKTWHSHKKKKKSGL